MAPSYSESTVTGTSTFALGYGSRNATATRTELGAWVDKTVMVSPAAALALRLRGAWVHDHSSGTDVTASFQALPGASFTVSGATLAPNAALLSAGAEMRLANHVTIGAKLDGEFARGSRSYAGTGTVRYAW